MRPIFALVVAAAAVCPSLAQAQDAPCRPPCRDGFLCVDGECRSLCNPPCPQGEDCMDGACVALGASAPPEELPEEPKPPRTWRTSAKIGYFAGNDVSFTRSEPVRLEGSQALGGGVFLQADGDYTLLSWLTVGGLLQFATVNEGTALNFGPLVRGRIPIGDFIVRPGVSFGVETVRYDPPPGADANRLWGFNLGLSVETLYPFTPDFNAVVQLGFISMPAGGNNEVSASFGPQFYFAVGVEYGQ